MNIAIIKGNIVREPDYRTTTKGNNVCSFTVAVNRKTKDELGNYLTDFINCVAWRNNADFVHNNFFKGSGIIVTGEIQTRSYVPKDSDKTVHITEVVVREVEFNGRKEKKEETQIDDFTDIQLDDAELPF